VAPTLRTIREGWVPSVFLLPARAKAWAHCAGLLLLAYVQLWQTENGWGLDRSHRGSHRRDIPGVVDAADLRTVNAVKNLAEGDER
jgi:hypothetical protein